MIYSEFIQDPALVGVSRQGPTWRVWDVLARAGDAAAPRDGDLEIFTACTGRTAWPTRPAREIWINVGRRSGKTSDGSNRAAHQALFTKYIPSQGEIGLAVVVAPTKQQAAVTKGYIGGILRGSQVLASSVLSETQDEIRLTNNMGIMVLASDFRSLRGFSIVCGVVDEAAYLAAEGARPAEEVVRSLRPPLLASGGPLIVVSSPYSRQGILFEAYQRHFGKDGDVLFWKAASTTMHPGLDEKAIARALEEDPEGGRAEWLAEFRSDVESFVTRDAVEAAVVAGRHELPPLPAVRYFGFVDPSGGAHDSYTLGIAFREGEKAVLALLRERKPPFSPAEVTRENCDVLKQYRCSSVIGDRYAGGWVSEEFQKNGIRYEPSSRSKSEIYAAFLGPLNSGRVELLDNSRLVQQLVALERRTSRGGRDSIDHPPGGHDDLINAAAGGLVEAARPVVLPGIALIGGDDDVPERGWRRISQIPY